MSKIEDSSKSISRNTFEGRRDEKWLRRTQELRKENKKDKRALIVARAMFLAFVMTNSSDEALFALSALLSQRQHTGPCIQELATHRARRRLGHAISWPW